jgi:uncharacterized protein YjbI with pentapeptide repeats
MVVRQMGCLGAVVAMVALTPPSADACGMMPPELTRANGQPLLSVEDIIRDVALVADGEVVGISTEKICVPKDPSNCIDVPSAMLVRIDKAYKGALQPVVEVAPLAGCDSDGGVAVGLEAIGARIFLIADTISDRMQPFYSTARYSQTYDPVGVPESEWERFRGLWLDLEARAAEHPADAGGWLALARAMEQWRDYPRALKAYDRLAALLPQDLDIQASRGRMLFYLRAPEAEAVLSRVVAERPMDAKSRSLLALLRYQRGEAVSLTGLDLSNTDLRGRSFRGVDFSRSDFSGADLRGSTELIDVILNGAKLKAARFYDGFPLYDRINGVSLRDADFTGSSFEDIPWPADHTGIKLSGVRLPVNALLRDDFKWLMDSDLAGARIGCARLPEAEWWQETGLTSVHTQYRRDRWRDYLDELNQALRLQREKPAAMLDTSCSEAIRNHLHEKCAPWVAKSERPPECKIDF